MVFFLSCFKKSVPGRKLVAIATKKIKNLVQNYWSDLKIIWHKWSFADSRPKIVSKYDQEIPHSQTADNPLAPRGRAAQPSRDTRKTHKAKQPALSSPSR